VPARRVAVEVLLRVEQGGAFANLALDAALRRARLSPRDRALATQIAYGVLRWRGRLDWIIGQAAARSMQRIALPVRCVLRAAAYQLLFLERVPAYAAVDQAVRQARDLAGARVPGFVNGVLRQIARTRGEVPYPDPASDPAGYLAAYASLPRWIAERWVARLGLPEATELALASNTTPPVTYMANLLKASPEGARRALQEDLGPMVPGRWAPGTFSGGAGAAGPPGEARALREGLACVMDEAAVLPVHLLDLRPGERVLDACAGGGGKAAVAAGMLQGKGLIVALEPQAQALRRLREACARLGLACVHPVQGEAQRAGAFLRAAPAGDFDAVLVDAPCSGLGTLRRHPEIKWRATPGHIAELAALQEAILGGVARCVRPGGVLVYATCTTEPEENEEVVEVFLNDHPDFWLEDSRPFLPGPAASLAAKGYLRTWPHRHGIDGFFAARLRRGAGSGDQRSGRGAR
jgi:16S rRNA (cytosine967-C5)-methyltransferase